MGKGILSRISGFGGQSRSSERLIEAEPGLRGLSLGDLFAHSHCVVFITLCNLMIILAGVFFWPLTALGH